MIDFDKWTHDVNGHGSVTVYIKCPKCSGTISMPNHWVQDNGNIFPAACCPRFGCKFNGHVRLAGWVPIADK